MSGGFNLGLKAIRKLVEDQLPLAWHKAKLSPAMFKGEQELQAFEFVNSHITKYHALPKLETVAKTCPEIDEISCPEPAKYYLDKLDARYAHKVINDANLKSQELLKEDKENATGAVSVLEKAIHDIKQQQYRNRMMDFGSEAPNLVLSTYHNADEQDSGIRFYWPYLDNMGGVEPDAVVSFIGRPAAGKTFKVLRTAMKNWQAAKNILLVSMEMAPLSIAQRVVAMYGGVNLTQLKKGAFATPTYSKFKEGLKGIASEKSKFYVVDGNLAATPEDIYLLAAQLGVNAVFIDGAYLLRHHNPRLDRYTKVAENCEIMKHLTGELAVPTFASWQFNRDASKKQKQGGGQKGGLEDIAFSDAIGQISSIVLALFQEDGVETLYHRVIDLLKGRDGQVGQFKIHWDFTKMIFDQIMSEAEEVQEEENINYT